MKKEIWGFLGVFVAMAAFGSSESTNSGVVLPERSPGPIPLERTSLAPIGAIGSALFVPGGVLSIQVNGLSPGNYIVEAVSKSGEQLIILAPLDVVDPTDAPDRQANDNFKQPGNAHQSAVLIIHTQVALPPEVKAGDIKKIVIAQASGSQVMVGTLRQQ